MKLGIISTISLLLLAHAQAATTKPGTVSKVQFATVITTEGTPTQASVTGGTRTTYASTSVRFGNRELLTAMNTAKLLDNTITGWSLVRLAGVTNSGNLYAVKTGKAAVAVPANLLTQPTTVASARNGVLLTPTTGTAVPAIKAETFGTLNVKGSAASSYGKQQFAAVKLTSGSTTTVIQTQAQSVKIVGKGASASSVIEGTYSEQKPKAGDLSALLPGNATP